MSSEKLKVTIERKNVEPVEFEANALLCGGDTDDGVLFFCRRLHDPAHRPRHHAVLRQ